MTRSSQQEVTAVTGATTPEQLGRLLLQRANAGDAARCQRDGTWLWAIDHPRITRPG